LIRGLTRQSIASQELLAKKMDPRVKPAGDELLLLHELTPAKTVIAGH
jgi:hypothetical protein